MRHWIPSLIFAILALLLIIMAFNHPMYYHSAESDLGDISIEYKLNEAVIKTDLIEGAEVDITLSYDDDDFGEEDIVPAFQLLLLILIITIIITIIFIIAIVISGARRGRGTNAGIIIGAFVFLLLIINPILFMTNLTSGFAKSYEDFDEPPGIAESFWGSDGSESWGPGPGWYIFFIGFIMAILSVVYLARSKRQFYQEEDKYDRFYMADYDVPEKPAYVEPVFEVAEPEPTGPRMLTLECPKCNSYFKTLDGARPIKIECPHCGVKGEVN